MAVTRTDAEEEERVPERDDEPEVTEAAAPDAQQPDRAGKRLAAARRRLPQISDPLPVVAGALAVIAAVCAAWFGWSWYSAAHDDSLAFSRSRDSALRAGEQGVLNMNTLDYRSFDQGLDRWVNSTTGDLQQSISQGRAQFQSQVQQAKTITTAKLLAGGVVELDNRAGKATVIVAVQITVTPQTGQPVTKQSRMLAQLARTPEGWKLSALGQAPTG